MDDSELGKHAIYSELFYFLLSILLFFGWLLAWRVGGLVAWIVGPILLAVGEQAVVSLLYVLRRGSLDFSSEHKAMEHAVQAAVVGIWLRHAGAPFFSLLIVPLSDGIINAANRRIVPEGTELLPLASSVSSTFAGQMVGYLLYWALTQG